MSLAADEGEGEQNEMRTLQLQLENTQRLLSTLSLQLSDVKDQVWVLNCFAGNNYQIRFHFYAFVNVL